MDTNWQSNSTSKQELKPRAEFQAAIMKLWESVRRSGQLIQSLNLDNENLTAKISEMEQHLRDRGAMLIELEARQAALEGELAAYENLQNNYQASQDNVSAAFLKIQHLEQENAELRQQVENFGELEKSLSLLQKEIVRRNAEMNSRINESFKLKSQIAELESKIFEMNGLRAELDELRGIVVQLEQNGSFQNTSGVAPDAEGFVVSYDADMAAVIDAVRQEEEKLRDEYEIIMVRQQEALDKYAENLLKAERENAEKEEFLKDLQQRVGDYEEAYISQKDVIAGLQLEVDLYKEQGGALAENNTQAMAIMIEEISGQKQRAELERNELAEELMKTRQMFALAQQQIQDLQKIEDEYEQMRRAHNELGQRVDEMQSSQKKSYDFQEVVTSLQEKVAELQGRFKEDGEATSQPGFFKNNGDTKNPAEAPFKKPEVQQPEIKPEIRGTETPEPEIIESEPAKPLKRQPETKPGKVSKEKPAANPAKDMMVDRMAALLERLEKSIQ